MRPITFFFIIYATLSITGAPGAHADSIVSWGYDDHNQVSGTPSGTGYTAIAHGWNHSLALQVQAGPTVPEPAAILLALFGLALLPRSRRR